MKKLVLLVVLLSTPSWAANTFIQKCLKTQAAAASTACTLAGAVTAGNFIVVGIVNDGSGVISSVVDQASNAYTVLGPCINTGRAWIAYRENVPGTAASGTTITVNWSSQGNAQSIWPREFSGVATSSSIDVSQTTTSCTGTGTTVNLPSITPTVSGDLLYGVSYYAGAITATGGSWAAADGNIQNGEADEYTLSGTTSATTVNWAGTPSSIWAGAVASFKAASGGGATPTGNKADKLQNLEGAALR